jgi:hypothetical protein
VESSDETNPQIWDSNHNESFAYFEKDSQTESLRLVEKDLDLDSTSLFSSVVTYP